MAFNPALPAANSPIASAELHCQLTGLKDLIDARPDTAGRLSRPFGTYRTSAVGPQRWKRWAILKDPSGMTTRT